MSADGFDFVDDTDIVPSERFDPPGEDIVARADCTVQTIHIIMQDVLVTSVSTGGSSTDDAAKGGVLLLFGGVDDFILSAPQLPAGAAIDVIGDLTDYETTDPPTDPCDCLIT